MPTARVRSTLPALPALPALPELRTPPSADPAPRARRAARVAYIACTLLIAAAFISGGAAYLAGAEVPLRGMAELGYPSYFVALLGAWKLAGGIAVLAPGLPRVKEWAYAGIVFDLTGAAVSHAATGHPAARVVVPLVLLVVAVASWGLRPADRRLDVAGRASIGG